MRLWELELALVQSQFPLRPNPRALLSSDSALSQPCLPAGKPQPPDSRWSPGTNSQFVPRMGRRLGWYGPVARRCQGRKDPRSQNRSDGAPAGGVVGLGSLGEFELAIRVFAKNKFKKESPGHPAYLSLLRGNLTADDNLIPMRPSSGDRNEVVFAGAMKLEYEKHRRVRADVCYKMRTTRPHGVGLTRGEAYLLLGLLKEDSQA